MMTAFSRWNLSRFNIIAGIVILIGALGVILSQHKNTLWDFYTYYGAAAAVHAGVDPYTHNYFDEHFGESAKSLVPYVYPPLMLLLFKPLIYLTPLMAALLWCLLKSGALLFICWIVRRKFFDWTQVTYAIPFLILAFNATLYWDLVTGNFSLFEQTGIWIALVCLLHRRPGLFTACIVIVSQVKLLPVLFLGLLLVYDDKPKWAWFTTGALAFFGLFHLNAVFYPQYTQEFFQVASQLSNEKGISNAATFIFIRELINIVRTYHIHIPTIVETIVYLSFVATVGLTSWVVLQRYKRNPEANLVTILFFFCVTYAVILPRFKSYQYALIVFPTLYLILKQPRVLSWPLVLTLVMFPHPGTGLPGPIQKLIAVSFDYIPVITLYLVWISYACFMWPCRSKQL